MDTVLFGDVIMTSSRRRKLTAVYTVRTYKYKCIPDKWPTDAVEEASRMLRDVDIYIPSGLVQFFIRERKAGRLPALLRSKEEPAYRQLFLFEEDE